jgi:hypothetical protein
MENSPKGLEGAAEDGVPRDSSPREPIAPEKKCMHVFVLESNGWRRVETYKCIKCGELKFNRWYDL